MINQLTEENKYDQETLFDGNSSSDPNYSSSLSSEERREIIRQLETAQQKGLKIERIYSPLHKTETGDTLEVRSRAFKDIGDLGEQLLFFHKTKTLYLYGFSASYALELPAREEYEDLLKGEFLYGDEDEFIKRCTKVRHFIIRYAS